MDVSEMCVDETRVWRIVENCGKVKRVEHLH